MTIRIREPVPLGVLGAVPPASASGFRAPPTACSSTTRAPRRHSRRRLKLASGARRDVVEIDLTPFLETARSALRGAVARRALCRGRRRSLRGIPKAIHPVTRRIISAGGRRFTAADAFARVLSARRTARARRNAALCAHRRADGADRAGRSTRSPRSQADPIALNSRLGTYTNFVNLLDLAATRRAGGVRGRRPAVRHHAARARPDRTRCSRASDGVSTPHTGLPLGATGLRSRRSRRLRPCPRATRSRSPWSARISPACRSTTS